MTILFRRVHGKMDPVWPKDDGGEVIAADGREILTVEQAEQASGISSRELRRMWDAAFGGLIPATDVLGAPLQAEQVSPPRQIRSKLSDHEILELWREVDFPELTTEQFELFIAKREALGIPRFARGVYPYVRERDGKTQVNLHTTMEEYRRIAHAQPDYAGEGRAEWCGADGKWVEAWLPAWEPGTPKPRPAAARVSVFRMINGVRTEFCEIARWSAYAPYVYDTSGGLILNSEIWDKMDAEQLAKCSLARGYRAAFGNMMKGLFTREEMDQAIAAAKTAEVRPLGNRPQPAVDGSQIREQAEAFLEECQLDAFQFVDNPPDTDEEFERQLAELVPDAQTRAATIEAFRTRFKSQYRQQRQQWYVSVLAAVKSGSRRSVLN